MARKEPPALRVESVPLAQLTPDPANARKHPERNLETIKASLKRFGQQKPIVVTPDGVIVAGNGTFLAAQALGWEKIAVVRTKLGRADATAFAIADNRTAELAGWDDQVLAGILSDPDLGDVGFTEKEIAKLTGQGEGDPLPPSVQISKFLVVITCRDEAQQVELLEKFQGDGFDCKGLVG